MSQDQEPTEAQKLRHLLRDLHRQLDPDAPRFLSTRQRAAALLAKLSEMAADTGLTATPLANGTPDEHSPSAPPSLPASSRSARPRARATSSQPRRQNSAAAAAEPAGISERADAAGVSLAEPEPAPERTWRDVLAEWWFG